MNLHRAFPALAIGLAAVVVLAGCGKISTSYGTAKSSGPSAAATSPMPTMSSGAVAATPATGDTVNIRNYSFTPQTLTVTAGTKVTWTNDDTTVHDVTSTNGPAIDAATTGLFASGPLSGGESFSFTFTEPGTYHYECTIHASMSTMHATVVVK